MKKTFIIGGSIFLIGCLMFCVTMSFLQWDFKKLSRPPFEEKTLVVDNNNQNVTLESTNVDIVVALSEDDKIHFIYSEREKEFYEFDKGDDIAIKKTYQYKWYEYFLWNLYKENPFTILLPVNFTGKLDLTTSNAKIEIKDLSLQNVVAKNSNGKVLLSNVEIRENLVVKTDNAPIDLNNVQASGNIDLITNNGAVVLNDISAKSISAKTYNANISAKKLVISDNINLKTNNAEIELDVISANKSIILKTSNGSITGVLPGKMSDYNITSKTSNGKNSLPEKMPDGQIELNVSNSNGDIDIVFGNK